MNEYTKSNRLLSVTNLNVTYDKPILKNVNIHIDNIVREGLQQGQVVALLGPSGIGKSQLFRCLAGLQTPTSGSVEFNHNEKLEHVQPGQVGVVQQNYPLLNHRTILGNLMLVGSRETALMMLDKFGLVDKAHCYPIQLSGGQRQRVAILQQVMCSSHFLLMDEPFSGLDLIAKSHVSKTILDISTLHEFNTVIVITHDIEAALEIADTVWILGRDRNEKNEIIPGAYIKHVIDLIDRGIAWVPNASATKQFHDCALELKALFPLL